MTESTTTSPALGSDRAAEQVSAVVAHRDADGLVTVHYEHKSAPTPGPGDLIVRPEFVGVCGTDLELLGGHLDGDFPISYPLTLGHEWSGTVLTVGPEVTGFSAGDLVIGHGVLGGNHWFGVTDDGAMAERFRVSARQCFRVPDGVSAQRAAMVEPLACVLAGLQSVGGADGSQLAVVFGCGTLGLAMVGLLHSTGAAVVAIDPSSQRRELAERVGADLTLAPATGSDLSAQMATVFGVAGVDLVVEASGAPAAQAAALEVTGIGARVLYMGLSHGTAAAGGASAGPGPTAAAERLHRRPTRSLAARAAVDGSDRAGPDASSVDGLPLRRLRPGARRRRHAVEFGENHAAAMMGGISVVAEVGVGSTCRSSRTRQLGAEARRTTWPPRSNACRRAIDSAPRRNSASGSAWPVRP